MEFNKRLSSLRMKEGIRQSELARQIGVAKSTISAYESCKTKPSIEVAILLANYFKVSLDYLFGRTDYPNPVIDSDTRTLSFVNDNAQSELVKGIMTLISKYVK